MIAVAGVANNVSPDVKIALRHSGIGRQHEQYGVSVRHQRQRQLRLGADRVQPWSVQNHEPVLQQWMWKIDDGVTPLRDLDQAVLVDSHRLIGIVGVVEPVAFRLGYRNELTEWISLDIDFIGGTTTKIRLTIVSEKGSENPTHPLQYVDTGRANRILNAAFKAIKSIEGLVVS